MFLKALSVILLTCALSSGQPVAEYKGYESIWVKNVDHQLRHEVDSDELRAVAEELAEGLRERLHWQKSRKPEAGQRRVICCWMRYDALPGRQYHADLMSGE